jgi:hypothetical protein
MFYVYLNFLSLQVLVPIANGTEEMEAIIIIDILRRAKVNVVVASVEDSLEILASRKVKLEADVLLDEAAKLSYDLIVLPVSCFIFPVLGIGIYWHYHLPKLLHNCIVAGWAWWCPSICEVRKAGEYAKEAEGIK